MQSKMAAISFKEDGYPMKSVPSKGASARNLIPEPSSEFRPSQDETVLAYYGKRQQLKVSRRSVTWRTPSY